VTSARTAAEVTSPVEAFTPEGTSTAMTGLPAALIDSISAAASGRGSPLKPVPKSASTITSADAKSPDSSASRPASRSRRSAMRPSPPFAPPPQTPTNRRCVGNRSSAASATARPARSIRAGTSCPASAAFISSAV
jgi:hypothetical protein